MRKIISLGLFALMISTFSGQLFADVEDCEQVKGEKHGLYGLCIAYWSTTNPKARAKILANFEKNAAKDGVAGPGMPGLGGPECDCWTSDHVVDALDLQFGTLTSWSCNDDGLGLEVANFGGNTVTFFAADTGCFFLHPEDVVPPIEVYESLDTELTCRASVQEIVEELTGEECPTFGQVD